MTNGRVAAATGSVKGYLKANASIAVRIAGFECTLANRSVFLPCSVVKQRLVTVGSVVVGSTVVKQRKRAGRRILRPDGIEKESINTGSRVVVRRVVANECIHAGGGILFARGVVGKGL